MENSTCYVWGHIPEPIYNVHEECVALRCGRCMLPMRAECMPSY